MNALNNVQVGDTIVWKRRNSRLVKTVTRTHIVLKDDTNKMKFRKFDGSVIVPVNSPWATLGTPIIRLPCEGEVEELKAKKGKAS